MHWIVYFGLMIAAIPQVIAVCFPNTICREDRDTIVQLNENVLARERNRSRGRTWYILPNHEQSKFNAILAFKNFSSSHASVMVISYTTPDEKEIKYYYGDLGNFEVLFENTIGVIVYVPIIKNRNTADFVLNYYTGCLVLTSVQDQITFPQSTYQRSENQTACWYIQPVDLEDRKRIYFSIRDVNLNQAQRLAIWDVHTSQVITTAVNDEPFQIIAAQTSNHQSILVDLLCTEDYCSREFNSFFITYYALSQEDVTCVERQQACGARDDLRLEQCEITCPALQAILEEEYFEQIYMPMLRSGTLDDEFEVEAEMEREDRDDRVVPTPTMRLRQRCPIPALPPNKCSCPRSVKKELFCHSKIKCFSMGPCTFACIFHKVTTCLRLKVISSLKLL